MNKDEVQAHIEAQLDAGDSLVGFFQAMSFPKIWLFFLLGPFAFVALKTYFLAVTQRGIFFHRLNLLGKFDGHDFFKFGEIDHVVAGMGILQRPMRFHFKNDRTLKIKAQLKGVEKIAKLTPNVQQHLEENIRFSG